MKKKIKRLSAVKKTVKKRNDLTTLKRQLEIEAALEKVRVVAMSMRVPGDLLQICEALFKGLVKLGFQDLRNTMINIHDDDKKSFLNYDYSRKRKSITPFSYIAHPVITKLVKKIRSSEAFTTSFLKGKELDDFKKFREHNGEKTDSQLRKAEAIYYYFFSTGSGALGISSLKRASKEQIRILKKFRNVFELAYRRYEDIRTAEAQALEVRIEAALEKVRSRSLAMHHSDELEQVVASLFDRLVELGLSFDGALIFIFGKEERNITLWVATTHLSAPVKIDLPYDEEIKNNEIIRDLWKAIENGEHIFNRSYSGKTKDDYFRYVAKHNESKIPESVRKIHIQTDNWTACFAAAKNSIVGFDSWSGHKIRSEDFQILIRFAKAFEQAYTRFRDLQKAEEQTREAQIETALEKVRSRSLAMHKSDELNEVVAILFDKLQELEFGIDRGAVSLVTFPEDLKGHIQWIADAFEAYPIPFYVPFTEHLLSRDIEEARAKGNEFLTRLYTPRQKNEYFDFLFKNTDYRRVPAPVQEMILSSPNYALSAAIEKNTAILIPNTEGKLLSDKQMSILKRFSRMFEQCFVRFLDLQRSEVQAREAKIEAALERVRSAAMAMHSSDGILDVTQVLREQIALLGEKELESILVHIYHEDADQFEAWYSYRHPDNMEEMIRNGKQMLSWSQTARARKDKEKFYEVAADYTIVADYNMLKEWYEYLLANVPEVVEVNKKGEPLVPDVLYYNYSKITNGALLLITNSEASDHAKYLLKRAATVFNLAYSRFLDLQKAEAQARESEIQLALERVRARTMAMQKSDELAEVGNIMFREFKGLQTEDEVEQMSRGHITRVDEDAKVFDLWATDTDGSEIKEKFVIDFSEPVIGRALFKSWKTKQPYVVFDLTGEKLNRWFRYLESVTFRVAPELWGTRRVLTFIYDSKGFIGVAGARPLSEENIQILLRFANVFDQTYTRFLDLKKAEAQAKEAQIETALERVRSRTMAMHSSEELLGVITVVSEQFERLGIRFDNVSFAVNSEAEDYSFWFCVRGLATPFKMSVPYVNNPMFERVRECRPKGITFYADTLTVDESRQWHEHVFAHSNLPFLTDEIRNYTAHCAFARSIAITPHITLILGNYASVPYSDDENNILRRFALVFEQSYTRFLDLQKAEAQAREAQIEAGLERVRSKTMAMHNSQDVGNTVAGMFDELVALGLETSARCGIGILNESDTMELWTASTNDKGLVDLAIGHLNMTLHPLLKGVKKTWSTKRESFSYELQGEDLLNYFNILNDYPDYSIYVDVKALPDRIIHNSFYFTDGLIFCFTPNPISGDLAKIFKRFAGVFGQTYKRYLDLRNAEAQAREAEIQLALERVRARTMAMQKSKELSEVAELLFKQVDGLGIRTWTTGFNVWSDDNNSHEDWVTNPEGGFLDPYTVVATEHIFKAVSDARKRGDEFFVQYEDGETLKKTYRMLSTFAKHQFDGILASGFDFPEKQYEHFVFCSSVSLMFVTYQPVPEAHDIFRRFGKVFEQTYTRFLDLQKAEAQAREAQVEAALEKVRSRTMAMQRSDELAETSFLLDSQVRALGIKTRGCAFNIYGAAESTEWFSNEFGTMPTYKTPHEGVFLRYYEAGQRGETLYIEEFGGDKLKDHYDYLCSLPIVGEELIKLKESGNRLPTYQIDHVAYFKYGYLLFITFEPAPEAHEIFKRFAKVFEQTYTRFLDLQKAEAQAREAQIEAALERVRGKAMAMHGSKDLAATIGVFYRELESLSSTPRRCGVGLLDKETRIAELSTMNTTDQGDSIEIIGRLNMTGHPILEGVYDNWILQKEYHPVLRGNEIKEYYQLIRPQVPFPDYPHDVVQYGYFFFFAEGGVYAWTEKELSEDELKIYRRFTSVLSLTYKRYKELKDAEARTLTAIREASLDRVRAEIASMRTAEDLQRITPLVWRELIALGVPFFRCGVFIVEEQAEMIHFYLSNPDGKPLAVLHQSFNSLEVVKNATDHWRLQKVYTDRWDRGQFIAFTKSLIEQGQIETVTTYQGGDEPPESLTLQFVPFAQGMMYVGSAEPLAPDQIELVQGLAEAFSVAYARYEDFTRLETAKIQVENALKNLRATQTQLIQAEKMASLGELTAGIAHEIQNPLNFVNNFSEVSSELIDELVEEVKKRNFEDAQTIASDLKQNLEKINHHGKRADGIVKGMLQHSRTSSGQKELTDINVLCDEYLRLAYHGYRAKDKSFNAKFETEFDSTLEKVNIVPQDIGRVVLNLISNAFYAVNEKSKRTTGYEPTVTVSTKRAGDKVLIAVRDNGDGIPEAIKEKIFQPFFTTKPTGQGTGLGLSLSYDIVKAQGGELTVETREGNGTIFTIQLPALI